MLQHEGLELQLTGQVSSHKNQALMDNLALAYTTTKPASLLGSCTSLLAPGKLSVGTTEFPFSVELRPSSGVQLVETYHGVHVVASYVLRYRQQDQGILIEEIK